TATPRPSASPARSSTPSPRRCATRRRRASSASTPSTHRTSTGTRDPGRGRRPLLQHAFHSLTLLNQAIHMACRRRAPVSPRTRSPRRATQGRRSAPARRDGDLMDIFEDLRSAVDPARLRAHLEWFAGVRRDTGGPGEEAAAEYIAEQLRAAGVEVRVHEFPAFLSYPREAALEAVDAGGAALESFPCVTHSFAVSTPAEGIVEEVVLVGAGGFAGAAGKIAVVDGLCTPVTV